MKSKAKVLLGILLGVTSIAASAGISINQVEEAQLKNKYVNLLSKLRRENPEEVSWIGTVTLDDNPISSVTKIASGTTQFFHEGEYNTAKKALQFAQGAPDEFISFSVKNKKTYGSFSIAGENFSFTPIGSGQFVIVSQEVVPSHEEDVMAELCPDVAMGNCEPGPGGGTGGSGGGSTSDGPSAPSTPHIVRIMFVFDDGATRWGTSLEMIAHAKLRVAQLNDYLDASEAGDWLQAEYAGFYRNNYIPNTRYWHERAGMWIYTRPLSTVLSDAQNNSTIQALQGSNNADVVAVITNDGSGSYCGMATQIASTTAANSFFTVDADCFVNSLTLAHELGHLIGMRHNRQEDNSSAPYVYGHGYYSTSVSRRTIMSYQCEAPYNCTRIGQFSNPNLQFPGTSAYTGTYSYEYNVKVLRHRASVIAGVN